MARLGLPLLCALLLAARAYLALARRDEYARLQVMTVPRYPDMAMACDAWIRRNIGEHWAMPLDFSCDAMAEQTRLQTWTVKPAWLSAPQGPVSTGMKFGPRASVEPA